MNSLRTIGEARNCFCWFREREEINEELDDDNNKKWRRGANVVQALMKRETGMPAAGGMLVRTAAALFAPTVTRVFQSEHERSAREETKRAEERGREAILVHGLPTPTENFKETSLWKLESPLASNELYHDALKLLLAGPRGHAYIRDVTRTSPLLSACEAVNLVAIRCLLNAGAAVNYQFERDKISAINVLMQRASFFERFGSSSRNDDEHDLTPPLLGRMIRMLLEAGADPSFVDVVYGTPLHIAASRGYLSVAKVLLKYSGKTRKCLNMQRNETEIKNQNAEVLVRALGVSGCTPLHAALNASIVKLLISHGALVNTTDDFGYTPLLLAVIRNNIGVARELVRFGADASCTSADESSTLHFAVRHDQEELVRLLVDSGADVDARNSKGITPLLVAVANECHASIATLISLGADVNAADIDGNTALHFLAGRCAYYRTGIAEILLSSGAYINARNKKLETPLHVAAYTLATPMIEVLLSLGANRYARDAHGKRASDIEPEDRKRFQSELRKDMRRHLGVGLGDT